MTRLARCDCLNDCGDDPGIEAARVAPCARHAAYLARARCIGISRVAGNDSALLLAFTKPPSDDQLRYLHNMLTRL